jgi:hypothetical protein
LLPEQMDPRDLTVEDVFHYLLGGVVSGGGHG